MSITTKAMVVNVQIGVWMGHRLDKEATRSLTENANAEDDAARVNKHLIAKSAFKDITSTSNAIRSHFYTKTLPWKDNGDRLLTRTMYLDFMAEHVVLVDKFNAAVEQFLTRDYAAAVEQAGFRMGALFDISDYPAPAALRRKFYACLDVDAITEVGDFRVEMDAADVDQVRSTMEEAMGGRINNAMRDVWDRMAKVVGHFADRMSAGDERFRVSTLDNLTELVEVLPGLNLLEDPELERLRLEVKAKLCGHDAKDLRTDTAMRASVAAEAKKIMDDMAGFMRAFDKQEG